MNKIFNSLKNLLPADQVNEVSHAVNEMLEEAKKEMEAEFNKNLEEAYSQLTSELSQAEKTAYKGYSEAYSIIADLQERISNQKNEFENALEEGYEEAYQMLIAERSNKNSVESDLYEEYDAKLKDMKEYIVDKVDEFLQVKGVEIYEQAKRDLLADPRIVEHKVALDKIVNIASDYISGDEQFFSTSGKLEESRKSVEDLKGQLRMMEARNIRLSTENTKLNESVRRASEVISESRVNNTKRIVSEQKERGVRAKSVSGRGQLVTENVQVISESTSVNADNDLLVLSGIKKAK
jgi:regulator of replication initiation timing